MAASVTLLGETIARWYNIRRGLIREVSNIPPARLTFRATLEMRSVIDLVQHILEFSIITVEELLREDTNLHRASMSQLANVYAPNITRADSQEKLVNILVEQYKDAETRLEEAGDLHMMQLVPKLDGTRETRLTILQDTIQHEMYHRGQLTVYARLLGLEPALTKDLHSALPGSFNPGTVD
ncbi:MAG: DinB family protein [Bacteroidetes bacterium]|nr:DinB family protein [Bacteroidota bacterium]